MEHIQEALVKYWGYDNFLPLQKQAMECVSRGQDSIVVLPTGGGKSLCFQAPAVTMQGLTVVVSPLISLMKDQVDALKECGVPAARIDSSLSACEIAAKYNLSIKTIEGRRRRIMKKLNIESLAELIKYAIQKELIST